MSISVTAISLYVALAERVVALWQKVRGKKVESVVSDVKVEKFYRKRPVAKALIPLAIIALTGCSAFKAGNIEELKTLCETIVPCEPMNECKESATTGESTGVTVATETKTESADELDASLVVWDESAAKDAGSWPITAKITKAEATKDKLRFEHEQLTWKELQKDGWDKPARGNIWIIAKCADGGWHGTTIEWLWNQQEIEQRKWDGTDNLHSSCLASDFRPKAGTEAYTMLSTFARGGVWTDKQRTQLAKIIFP